MEMKKIFIKVFVFSEIRIYLSYLNLKMVNIKCDFNFFKCIVLLDFRVNYFFRKEVNIL